MVTIQPELMNKYIKKSMEIIKNQENENHTIPQRLGHGLNPEWIKEQFRKQNCELISEYENCNSEMTYKYDGKMYITTWKRFQKGDYEHK